MKNADTGAIQRSPPGNRNRRGFLGSVGAAAVGGVLAVLGGSGSSSASSPSGQSPPVSGAYTSPDAVRNAIARHAGDAVAALANDGYVAEASVSEFPTGEIHSTVSSYGRADRGVVVVTTTGERGPGVKIQVKRPLPDGRTLVLIVDPVGSSSAIVVHDTDDAGTALAVTTDDDGVRTTQSCDCDWNYFCGYGCSPFDNCTCVRYRVTEYTSCLSSCHTCEILDESCSGCAGDEACA